MFPKSRDSYGLVIGMSLLVAILLPVAVLAGEGEDLQLSASLEVADVTNANEVAETELQIDERQDTGMLVLAGDIERRHWTADLDYSLEARRYQKQVERDVELLLGRGQLVVGDASRSPLVGVLTYASEEVLINQQLGSAPDNLDQRKSARAELITGLGKSSDRVEVSLYYEKDRYRLSEAGNAKRFGTLASYMRGVNDYTRYGVEVDGYHNEYEFSDEVYDYRRAAIRLERSSRSFSLNLGVGANSTDGDSELERPYLDIAVWYRRPLHTFSMTAGHFITDTSRGNRPQNFGVSQEDLEVPGDEGEINPNGSLNVVDRYEVQQLDALWDIKPCSLCSLAFGVGYVAEDYENEPAENNTSRSVSFSAGYRMTRNLDLNARLLSRDTDFEEGDDYADDTLRLEVAYTGLLRYGRLALFAEEVNRDQQLGEFSGYSTSSFGIIFDYQILD